MKHFPDLKYSAALFGWGSETLGYDTQFRGIIIGARVLIFLSETDHPVFKEKIDKALSENLPYEFLGYSTNFSKAEANGVRHPIAVTSGPVNHMVNIFTTKSFFEMRLNF